MVLHPQLQPDKPTPKELWHELVESPSWAEYVKVTLRGCHAMRRSLLTSLALSDVQRAELIGKLNATKDLLFLPYKKAEVEIPSPLIRFFDGET